MTSFKDYDENTWTVKKAKPKKVRDLNPKTNRMKKFRRTDYMVTDIAPEKRSFKNLPKYADGKSKVKFQDWLMIKPEKRSPEHDVASFGKSDADGKWYGWSHRAVYGFKVGDVVKADSAGNDTGKEYTIKTDDQARQAAINFASDVS